MPPQLVIALMCSGTGCATCTVTTILGASAITSPSFTMLVIWTGMVIPLVVVKIGTCRASWSCLIWALTVAGSLSGGTVSGNSFANQHVFPSRNAALVTRTRDGQFRGSRPAEEGGGAFV